MRWLCGIHSWKMNGPVPDRRAPQIALLHDASRATIADHPPAMPASSEALGALVTMRTVSLSGVSMVSMALR